MQPHMYKLVERDSNGKVKQIHEIPSMYVEKYIHEAIAKGNTVTVSKLA